MQGAGKREDLKDRRRVQDKGVRKKTENRQEHRQGEERNDRSSGKKCETIMYGVLVNYGN